MLTLDKKGQDNIRALPMRLKSVTSDLVKGHVQMSHVLCLVPHMMPQYVGPPPHPQKLRIHIAYRKFYFPKSE